MSRASRHAEMEQKLRESEEKYRLLFESANDGIFLLDRYTAVDCNRRAAAMFGCSREELLGSSVERFIPPMQADGRFTKDILAEKGNRVLEGEPELFEVTLNRCDGTAFEVEISLNYVTLHGRKMVQSIVRDISERKKLEDWLRYINMHDKPTGLYNRNYFEEEMQRLQSGRFDPVGIVVCDVDGLKLVNDNLGHEAGDHLLVAAARVLIKCFRDNDVVARIGGDEFAVLLPDCGPQVVENACQRIKETLVDYRSSHPPIPISLSVGWAVKKDNTQSMWEVFRSADNRMYAIKPENRAKFKEIFATMVEVLRDEP